MWAATLAASRTCVGIQLTILDASEGCRHVFLQVLSSLNRCFGGSTVVWFVAPPVARSVLAECPSADLHRSPLEHSASLPSIPCRWSGTLGLLLPFVEVRPLGVASQACQLIFKRCLPTSDPIDLIMDLSKSQSWEASEFLVSVFKVDGCGSRPVLHFQATQL